MSELGTTAAGHPILRRFDHDAAGAMRAGAVVLADISASGSPHPYVTWWMDEDGNTYSGDYCATLEEAEASFEARVERERVRFGL